MKHGPFYFDWGRGWAVIKNFLNSKSRETFHAQQSKENVAQAKGEKEGDKVIAEAQDISYLAQNVCY